MNRLKDYASSFNEMMKPYLINAEIAKNISDKEAKEYLNTPNILEDGINRAKLLNIKDNSKILEIGPGPGVLTIELLKNCKKLLAVEPVLAMANLLRKRAEEYGLENLIIENKFWENFETKEKFDYIVSSLSIQFEDILSGIKKMNELAKTRVYIFWFDSEMRLERKYRLAEEIFGIKNNFQTFPKLIHLEPILKELDINYKKIKLPDVKYDGEYILIQELIESIKTEFSLSDIDNEKILEYINTSYEIKGDYAKYIDKTKFALIYWDK